ncbi:MAG: HD domain-containing protein [Betaproteobacteria bacterium]|nr:HD domain-containing protein [Betaproteobacteria bacterium]
MLQRIAVEPGHRGPTVALTTTKRVVPFRQQPCALLIEALSVAAERRRDPRRRRRELSGGLEHAISLVHVLCNEAGITDDVTLAAAVLHDTLVETQATYMEMRRQFGPVVAEVVAELADDVDGPVKDRPALRLQGGGSLSHRSKLIRLAQQVVSVRELAPDAEQPHRHRLPASFDAIRSIVENLRGTHATLEYLFDEECTRFQAA